jgi:hypothetical protein
MKAVIDRSGYLRLKRPYSRQGKRPGRSACPFALQSLKACGDWCPLFGEPEKLSDGRISLPLCTRTLVLNEFFDEREPRKEDLV